MHVWDAVAMNRSTQGGGECVVTAGNAQPCPRDGGVQRAGLRPHPQVVIGGAPQEEREREPREGSREPHEGRKVLPRDGRVPRAPQAAGGARSAAQHPPLPRPPPLQAVVAQFCRAERDHRHGHHGGHPVCGGRLLAKV
eukprot:6202154-Prymnesium_polylepis.1